MYNKKLVIIVLGIILVLLSGGVGYILGKAINNEEAKTIHVSGRSSKVDVRMIDCNRMASSGTAYTIKLTNVSKYLIKQNSLYVSYPIKHHNGQIVNKCKAEATGNKIDIKPNEEVTLNVFIPYENYQNNNKLDINRPEFEIEGYFNKINNLTHFEQYGALSK